MCCSSCIVLTNTCMDLCCAAIHTKARTYSEIYGGQFFLTWLALHRSCRPTSIERPPWHTEQVLCMCVFITTARLEQSVYTLRSISSIKELTSYEPSTNLACRLLINNLIYIFFSIYMSCWVLHGYKVPACRVPKGRKDCHLQHTSGGRWYS